MALHWKIIIGLILGVIWAIASSYFGLTQFTLDWINPFGVIFINLLKLIAVPLVLFSIIKGVAGLKDASKLGRLGLKTVGIYILTTILAVTIGLGLSNLIKPGTLVNEEQRITNRIGYELWINSQNGDKLIDGKSFLDNPAYADKVEIAKSYNAKYAQDEVVSSNVSKANATKNTGPLQFFIDIVPTNIFLSLNDNGLMLQIIFFAIFFGITLISLPSDKSKPLIEVIDAINEVFLKMVDTVMKGAPFFVFALLAGKISQMAGDNPASVIEIFKGLSWYSLTVVLALAIVLFVVYPLVYKFVVPKRGYTDFFKGIGPAQMLAFSTSSSAATLPVTMECVRDRMGVSEEVSSFVLPIGATVNMDGTSLYQAVAVMFLAQFHFVDLTLSQQLMIVFTATLASIGSAAVPSAGLIMLIIVLEAVGLNPAWIAIIFPVDRILDMCRTVINVSGDALVSSVIARSENQLTID